jgi:hypothetical protein
LVGDGDSGGARPVEGNLLGEERVYEEFLDEGEGVSIYPEAEALEGGMVRMKVQEVMDEVFKKIDRGTHLNDAGSRSVFNNFETELKAYWVLKGVAGLIVYESRKNLYAYGLSNAPLRRWNADALYEVSVEKALEEIDARNGVVEAGFSVDSVLGKKIAEVRVNVAWDSESDGYERHAVRFLEKDGVLQMFQENRNGNLRRFTKASDVRTFYDAYIGSTKKGEKRKMRKRGESNECFIRSGDLPEEVMKWLEKRVLLASV